MVALRNAFIQMHRGHDPMVTIGYIYDLDITPPWVFYKTIPE